MTKQKKELEELREILKPEGSEHIKKTVRLQYDGKQYMVRFPVIISDLLKMKKGMAIKFDIEIPHPETKKEITSTFEVVENVH